MLYVAVACPLLNSQDPGSESGSRAPPDLREPLTCTTHAMPMDYPCQIGESMIFYAAARPRDST